MANVRFIIGPDQGDAEFVVLALELHEELIVIDIATTLIEAVSPATRRLKLPKVRVEDDLGNGYEGEPLMMYGAGWSGNAPAAHYAYEVMPAISPEASFLRITFESMREADRSVVVML